MCKFWKKEKCNHHFQELKTKISWRLQVWNGLTKRRSLIGIGIVVAVLGIVYLTQTNLTATIGYQIKDLENGIAKLQSENGRLTINYLKLQSMDQITASAADLNLIPAGSPEIVMIRTSNQIAKR
ncbi:MAG: hypothetical protein WC668_02205 [Patescibacteria group bacterium]|jgi:hypothetical protein